MHVPGIFIILIFTKMKNSILSLLLICFFTGISHYQAQGQSSLLDSLLNFSNGIVVTAPNDFLHLRFRFRTQLRAGYQTVSAEDFSAQSVEARVRRMRLRFEGYVLDPKLNYYVQLSFSRGDMDWNDNNDSEINSSPNIARDVVFMYLPNEHWELWFGQTKLPGNRQRVNSSGELQFPDRSIVNASFNIDRDFGVHLYYKNRLGGLHYRLAGAISTGEGRNITSTDGSLAYTARAELLPFGLFTNDGDYFEGDLAREPRPKLSLGLVLHHNEDARRTAGTIGNDLYAPSDIRSISADMMLKYRGIAWVAEYHERDATSPITTNAEGDRRVILNGRGYMTQLSYLFKNNLEIASRYGLVVPDESVESEALQRYELGLGVTKYLNRHRVKLQAQLLYNEHKDLVADEVVRRFWAPMVQIELGL